ncbi:uncharacterized protein BT62DRAFT_930907 [Guyanagaster necrorhizus]|uniref:Uncharacterized protein n=1 Tax=Guyanagaster necrorhizus TaxID=856835 RepID=A0A9P7VVY1_9AGAR|nr:uncharacterized protein BT62DRAFT_930907 [Guyanagaster necrorhizus MCA 3950]KAG7447872.1 hypothetical protein BT62DRAFT_930907 [Guyanagaster necrorhizus MCA 3950]
MAHASVVVTFALVDASDLFLSFDVNHGHVPSYYNTLLWPALYHSYERTYDWRSRSDELQRLQMRKDSLGQ